VRVKVPAVRVAVRLKLAAFAGADEGMVAVAVRGPVFVTTTPARLLFHVRLYLLPAQSSRCHAWLCTFSMQHRTTVAEPYWAKLLGMPPARCSRQTLRRIAV
jgi:hypothetical protein